MPAATNIQFGDGLGVTDLGGGAIRVDAAGPGPTGLIVVTSAAQLPATPAANQIVFAAILDEGPVPLLYDSTISKWVTAPRAVVVEGNTEAGTYGTSATVEIDTLNDARWHRQWMPMKVWTDAGFKPQVRFRGQTKTPTPASGGQMRVTYFTSDANQQTKDAQVLATPEIGTGNGQFTLLSSGWNDITAGYTVKDFILFSLRTRSTGGLNEQYSNWMVELRWVA